MSDIVSNDFGPPLRPHNPVLPRNRFEAIAACRAPRRLSDRLGVEYYYVAWAPTREPNWSLQRDVPHLLDLAFDCVETAHENLSGASQTLAISRSGHLGASTKNYITRLYRAAATHFSSLATCDVQLSRGGPLRSLDLEFPEFATTHELPDNLQWLDPDPEPAEHPPVVAS